ncbi:MAG: universal stress protein [Myxococcaceae bacterium]|nr:universal stress protein [Myxococcaceae bacterium]
MKTIIAALDGSDPALHAATKAAELARALGARLVLTSVVTPVFIPMEAGAIDLAAIEDAMAKDAEAQLTKAATTLQSPGLKIDRKVLRGTTVECLIDLAQKEQADLVVVGSHGRGAVQRALLGSVSSRLVHQCPRPVLVVR